MSSLLLDTQVELRGYIVVYIHLLRICQNVFQSSCHILHSYQQCMKVPIPPHPQTLTVICLLDYSLSSGCEVVFIAVLIYISLMTNDVEHLFMCLLAIYTYSLKKCLFQTFCPCFDCIVILLLGSKSSL